MIFTAEPRARWKREERVQSGLNILSRVCSCGFELPVASVRGVIGGVGFSTPIDTILATRVSIAFHPLVAG